MSSSVYSCNGFCVPRGFPDQLLTTESLAVSSINTISTVNVLWFIVKAEFSNLDHICETESPI